jgi:glyoxylase-like metal-dependent hydrolase (beta-lactamase superfamily II)
MTAVPQIANVRGDLYRVQVGDQATVFLVTPQGIILADPLSYDVAAWLRKELESRFPGRPVRYLLHTHHHFDRAEGASVFNDTAELVGHREFNHALSDSRVSLQPDLVTRDRNRNGILERDELGTDAIASRLLTRDINGDGDIARDEMYRRVRDVEAAYKSGHIIHLADRTVQLVYTGAAHSTDMMALYFPSERVVFAADHPSISDSPFSFGTAPPKEVVRWVDSIAALDFDVLVSSDSTTTTRVEIQAIHQYLADLVTSVSAGYALGLPVDQLQRSSLLGKYVDGRYALRDAQVAQVYGQLRSIASDVYGAALMNRAPQNIADCGNSPVDTCRLPETDVPSGLLGMRFSYGRVSAGAEARAEGQRSFYTASASQETTVVHRETLISSVLRVDIFPRHRIIVAGVGGVSFALGETRGVTFIRQGIVPRVGPHFFGSKQVEFGTTFGADVGMSFGDRVSIVMPVRMTRLTRSANENLWGRVHTYVGVGLSFRLFRHTYFR